MKVVPSVVPGWHMAIYPPGYIIKFSLTILFLLIAIIGYAFIVRSPINFKVFLVHVLLTLPLVIALSYPFKTIDISLLPESELERLLAQRNWLEYSLFLMFAIGQFIFLIYLAKCFKLKTAVK
jgi:hypothetical protein